ncbi:MAG TPA: hypothetical protein VI894_00905 [Candidatus Nanoarchaeia archaeon]|nr:hypothetical protein [Candidatus Nanoarchaeia archaeon]
MYKAAIFDLDGTLVCTLPEYIYSVVKQALTNMGILSFPEEHSIDAFWFETKRDEIIRKCFLAEPAA